ncbi:hypothetical protein B0H16DRAFT_1817095 [Mycena metata]|uniref:Telomeric single stranded DNA binding POT1/Cdc13 domain-containing protein n=1 Tax=Mycena metata TaxID=1033252 RepID=A0AAD7K8Z2_9AGAR|nr:hypothetical protein B0H16DRAFT_1817095 [Mycena metata]
MKRAADDPERDSKRQKREHDYVDFTDILQDPTRAADVLERDSKRQKREHDYVDLSALFQDPTHEKNGAELVNWTPGELGFISGTIVMKWPFSSGKYRVQIQMTSPELGEQRLDVVFCARCAQDLRRQKFEFKLHSELFLSLEKASRQTVSGGGTRLPVLLRYSDGVALDMRVQGQESGCKIDTCAPEISGPSVADEWFNTPPVLQRNSMDVDEKLLHPPPAEPAVPGLTAGSNLPPAAPEPPKVTYLSSIGNSLASPPFTPDAIRPSSSSDPKENPQPSALPQTVPVLTTAPIAQNDSMDVDEDCLHDLSGKPAGPLPAKPSAHLRPLSSVGNSSAASSPNATHTPVFSAPKENRQPLALPKAVPVLTAGSKLPPAASESPAVTSLRSIGNSLTSPPFAPDAIHPPALSTPKENRQLSVLPKTVPVPTPVPVAQSDSMDVDEEHLHDLPGKPAELLPAKHLSGIGNSLAASSPDAPHPPVFSVPKENRQPSALPKTAPVLTAGTSTSKPPPAVPEPPTVESPSGPDTELEPVLNTHQRKNKQRREKRTLGSVSNSLAASSPEATHPPAFSTPKESRQLPILPKTVPVRTPGASTSKLPPAAPEAPRVESPSVPDTVDELEPVLNKQQRKNKQRREKRKAKMADGAPPVPVPAAIAPAAPNAHSPALPTHSVPSTPAAPERIPQAMTSPPLVVSDLPAIAPTVVPPQLELPSPYVPLSKVKEGTGWITRSVIGVVTFTTTPKFVTRTGDWSCHLKIVDPSNCDESPLKVNCFAKHEHWSPTARPGDIVILCELRTKAEDTLPPVGYVDRLKWVVYDHTTDEFTHGGVGNATSYPPFHHPTAIDKAYCAKLASWWRKVSEKQLEQMGTIHQIGGGSSSYTSRAPGRKHQLVSAIQVDQFFDCTVQVIHGHETGDAYRLYCTDGTRLDGGRRCPLDESEHYPRYLAGYTFQIELCKGAYSERQRMRSGNYYRLENVRMKLGMEGREANMYEPKIRELDLEREAATDKDLQALIDRINQLKSGDKANVVDSEDLDLKLVKHVKDKEQFNCVVELLRKDNSQRAIYVSDYTLHPKAPSGRGLVGYTLRIQLRDGKIGKMDAIEVGQLYHIKNLRLQANNAQEFGGTLVGSHTLISPLNPKSSLLEEWRQGLVERKSALKSWFEKQTKS